VEAGHHDLPLLSLPRRPSVLEDLEDDVVVADVIEAGFPAFPTIIRSPFGVS
jgi:hypothetical protein